MAGKTDSKATSFAIIETGGKQYMVTEGAKIVVEKLDASEGDEVTFDKVLMTGGDSPKVGSPFIDKATVKGKLEKQARAKKIDVMRFKAKSRYHKRRGHKQHQSIVTITSI